MTRPRRFTPYNPVYPPDGSASDKERLERMKHPTPHQIREREIRDAYATGYRDGQRRLQTDVRCRTCESQQVYRQTDLVCNGCGTIQD